MPGWSTSRNTPRCVGPTTTWFNPPGGVESGDGAVVAGNVVGGDFASDALVTSPTSPVRRVTTPTLPGGTSTAGAITTRRWRGLILYVPGVSTSRCRPLNPAGTTSAPPSGVLPSCSVT